MTGSARWVAGERLGSGDSPLTTAVEPLMEREADYSQLSARTVTSDKRGRFTLVLAPGRYRLTPLRQAHTTGGVSATVTIQPAATTWTRVRFQGFPQML